MKYIVFLRGINVGGHRKILMKDLKELLAVKGFSNVITYIQSGNLVLETHEDINCTKENIEHIIYTHHNFKVKAIAIKPKDLENIIALSPFLKKEELNKVYFTLLDSLPAQKDWNNLISSNYGAGEIAINKNIVYLYCPNGYGKTKLNNNYIEKKLGCIATTRNLKTMHKMIELSNA